MDRFFRELHEVSNFLAVRTYRSINDSFCLNLVDVFAIGELLTRKDHFSLLLDQFSEEEKLYFSRFRYAKRQQEWLGGRLAAKYSLLALPALKNKYSTPNELTILPDAFGRPQPINMTAGETVSCSISHSSRFAVGIASSTKVCGIDIQRIGQQITRVVNRFADKKEKKIMEDRLPMYEKTAQLTMLWAAKEAVKKSLLFDQPSLFQGITLMNIRKNKNLCGYTFLCVCAGARIKSVSISVVPLEEYMLAYTGVEDHA